MNYGRDGCLLENEGLDSQFLPPCVAVILWWRRCGVVWCSIVQCGVVWCGAMWCYVVQCVVDSTVVLWWRGRGQISPQSHTQTLPRGAPLHSTKFWHFYKSSTGASSVTHTMPQHSSAPTSGPIARGELDWQQSHGPITAGSSLLVVDNTRSYRIEVFSRC